MLSRADSEILAPLSTPTLADQVADRIVEAIASRRLVSGQRLIETDLATSLGVSRAPVREASRILASQGIMVPSPRRGMRVANFDKAWAVQLHNARVAIERLAAHLVADNLQENPKLIASLDAKILLIERAVTNPDDGWFTINKADIAFHDTVFDLAGSPLLSTLWSAISRHVFLMFAIETYRDTKFERVSEEHHAYVEALKSNSTECIDIEIKKHVAGARIFNGDMEI